MKRGLRLAAPTRGVAWALCLWVLLAAGSASAQDVHTDYDHDVDFSRYKTFAWVESKRPAEGFADKRIKRAIEQQLAAKGLRPSAGATPDLYLVYKVGVRQVASPSDPFRYEIDPFGDTSIPSAQRISLEAQLVVDILEGVKRELVWRGTAVTDISEESAKNREKIQKVVTKMFKQFPPPPDAR